MADMAVAVSNEVKLGIFPEEIRSKLFHAIEYGECDVSVIDTFCKEHGDVWTSEQVFKLALLVVFDIKSRDASSSWKETFFRAVALARDK